MQNDHLCDPTVLTHLNLSGSLKQMNFFCSWETNKICLGGGFPVN